MPRVRELKPQYMEKDLVTFIRSKLADNKISVSKAATEIGITRQSLEYKLSNKCLKHIDIIYLLNMVDATDEEILKLMKL